MKKLIILLCLILLVLSCRTVYDSLEDFEDHIYKRTDILEAEYYPETEAYRFTIGYMNYKKEYDTKTFILSPNEDQELKKTLESRRYKIFVEIYSMEGADLERNRYYINTRLLKQAEYLICD